MIKKIFGIAPTKEVNGSGYIPSPMVRKLGVDKKKRALSIKPSFNS